MEYDKLQIENDITALATEINENGHNLGYIDEFDSIEKFSTIAIEKLIGKVNSSIHSYNYTEFLTLPTTTLLGIGAAILITNLSNMSVLDRILLIGLPISFFGFSLMIISSNVRSASTKKSYFVSLLEIYLKYK